MRKIGDEKKEGIRQRRSDAETYTIIRNAILKSGRKPDMTKERVQAAYAAYLAAEEAEKKAEQAKTETCPS